MRGSTARIARLRLKFIVHFIGDLQPAVSRDRRRARGKRHSS